MLYAVLALTAAALAQAQVSGSGLLSCRCIADTRIQRVMQAIKGCSSRRLPEGM